MSMSSVRSGLVRWLRADLMGPQDDSEALRGRPEARYAVGVLHPAFTSTDGLEADEALVADGQEDGDADVEPAYGGIHQSAVGISFTTTPDAQPRVSLEWGEYERPVDAENPEDQVDGPGDLEDSGGVSVQGSVRARWLRHQESAAIALDAETGAADLGTGLSLDWRGRLRDGNRIWTASFVNRRSPKQRPVFQPRLRISLQVGSFVARPLAGSDDPDAALAELLYRDFPEFAVGHGCAADWDLGPDGRATEVRTEFIPAFEIPAVRPSGLTSAELGQGALAAISDQASLGSALQPLVASYRSWIAEQTTRANAELRGALRDTALENLRKCTVAADRMDRGIARLVADQPAWTAFRVMNRAMALQRQRTLIAEWYRTKGQRLVEADEVPTWRPFQLAFILLNLEGVCDPSSADRTLVDLLWFPTGGGKTEAYLGLTAFSIALQRLQQPQSAAQGVTVLMRYTLRLLTTQQFERALTLVCACESIRTSNTDRWGSERMTIGLWVGQAATPNNYDTAKEARDQLTGAAKASVRHPFVVRSCPWCGSSLAFPESFAFADASRDILINCPNKDCVFSEGSGLPVLVVDEAIYRHPPALLLATVDKFARVPWEPDAACLFGRATSRCSVHGLVGDPEAHRRHLSEAASLIVQAEPGPGIRLIIQDELHLISGPLGTLVGAYEAAIDFLAGRDGFPPKVIASTATIRSATEQIRALYGRNAALFPPPAIDPFDSFFAEPSPPEEAPGRLYLGLTAPGTSMKTALIRVYASLLSAGVAARRDDEGSVDPYWTLVGYFNSLRELGGALSLMYDDVPKRLLAMERVEGRPARTPLVVEELTSRIPSHDIPNRLRQMEKEAHTNQALDAILASNMISVGVDVNRLGLMVVAGQPKGTAEYIQATSRVGRKYPGLIVTVYNWSRPRDLSHYERFRSYHAALYRHVEATSVTPLSSRARDRAMEGVIVGALRLADPVLRGQASAGSIASLTYADSPIAEFVRYFEERAQASDPDEAEAAVEDLKARIDRWMFRAKGSPLPYARTKIPPRHLIRPASDQPESGSIAYDPEAWRLLNSLRNVEREHGWYEP